MMMRIERFVKQGRMTQQAAARTFGVTQPRLNQLLKRKIELFSLDALVTMLSNAGMLGQRGCPIESDAPMRHQNRLRGRLILAFRCNK